MTSTPENAAIPVVIDLALLKNFYGNVIQKQIRSVGQGRVLEAAYWNGRLESYQHLLSLLVPDFVGGAATTQLFLDNVWEAPEFEVEEEEDEDEDDEGEEEDFYGNDD
ncbi:hypothetical protein COO91_02023 [Nostoc flagelliforme CCNUN1]|uniref:Uncharacterized protein n=1 Tax=Nostoc flagelliforme CCNUN1 TaxID=2038116 RepID=A0A2K8SKZ8_9NOSO|nr:hypothetical protein [Nostoc flagelliforme]AUB36122.1 hypothetical protein COO91_02023 [Nostoc flagelliforme CCNUN1]